MNGHSRPALVSRLFPEHLAALGVETEQFPLIFGSRRAAVVAKHHRQYTAFAGTPIARLGTLALVRDSGRYENFALPTNRLRPADAGEFGLPSDMLISRPRFGVLGVRGYTIAIWTPKSRPILSRGRTATQQ